MAQRFFGKTPHKKYVRPLSNSRIPHKVAVQEEIKEDKPSIAENEAIEKINIEKTKEDMNKEDKLESLMADAKAQKKRVKIEKKDKGIIERQEKEVVLITEDNKMVLTD